MKLRSILAPFMMACVAFVATSCSEKEDVGVKGIALDKSSITLKPGATEQLQHTLFPSNAANKLVTWSSTDTTVAKVKDGLVTAIKPGNVSVSVVSEDSQEKALCSVTVSLNDPITASGAVEGVWEKYSVVNVIGQISIPEGKSLTIEEGVEVIISDAGQDANGTKIEWIVNGSLYCQGTEEAPILLSVSPEKRTAENRYGRLWGGVIGSSTAAEILLNHTIVEYTGAITTLSSPSVVAGLFKPAGGEGMVAFNTNNPKGKYVIMNSIFRNTGEDAIYVQGGSCIFAHNLFVSNGEAGGEAINVKAGCKVDAAFNVMYSPNTNALKLSNAGADGEERFQAQINAYNNTIVNAGWRRDPNKPKGGSVWAESGCLVNIYNNLMVNCMFAAKAPKFGVNGTDGPDLNSQIDYNYYASGTQESVIPQHIANGTVTAFDGFKPGVKDVVYSLNDIAGSAAGDNDPLFAKFEFNTNNLLGTEYSSAWDFHLQATSPALMGAKTDFEPYFASTGVLVNGKEYKSPRPAAYFGAFGLK